jgi:hypothetical protein
LIAFTGFCNDILRTIASEGGVGFTGTNPFGAGAYAPEVAQLADFPVPDHRGLRLKPWTADMPRPGFYDSTIETVYSRLRSAMVTMPDGRQQLMYQCPQTFQWGPYDAFDIDHDMPWGDFLGQVRPQTEADAHQAYNDVRNLRAILSGANRSGDYNQVSDMEDMGSDSDSDFVVDDGPMSDAARQGLDDYLSQFSHWRAANSARNASSSVDAGVAGTARSSTNARGAFGASDAPQVADAAEAGSADEGLAVLADLSEVAEAAEILLLL